MCVHVPKASSSLGLIQLVLYPNYRVCVCILLLFALTTLYMLFFFSIIVNGLLSFIGYGNID